MTHRNHTFVLVLFALVLLASLSPGSALAQTPDGQTPSVEEACDLESGAAFGLCNAYCEAMDCHLGNDQVAETSPSASDKACSNVKNRFMQITAREVPCDSIVCPPGTEGCACANAEVACEGELSCNEAESVCTSEGGGDEY